MAEPAQPGLALIPKREVSPAPRPGERWAVAGRGGFCESWLAGADAFTMLGKGDGRAEAGSVEGSRAVIALDTSPRSHLRFSQTSQAIRPALGEEGCPRIKSADRLQMSFPARRGAGERSSVRGPPKVGSLYGRLGLSH